MQFRTRCSKDLLERNRRVQQQSALLMKNADQIIELSKQLTRELRASLSERYPARIVEGFNDGC
jgi:hypothetical protein